MSMDGSPYGTLTDTTLKLKRNTKCIKENRYKTRYKRTRKKNNKTNKTNVTLQSIAEKTQVRDLGIIVQNSGFSCTLH